MLTNSQIKEIRLKPNSQDWYNLSITRDSLSEDFLREFKDYVYWNGRKR